jgi:hypothetical protein
LEETKPKCVEGWEGKAKGILQVLWERGWIDKTKLNKYTINGKQDVFGVVDSEFSLKTLMANCRDFEEEETLLQSMGREMGISVDQTPKCHCKLAGEGIKYSWGCAKNTYGQMPLKDKKGKDKFCSAVVKCLSREKVLTGERIRLFSRRARAYICAYYKLWLDRQNTTTLQGKAHDSASDPVSIEKLVKRFKTHRCALDFDHGFCQAAYIDMTQGE